MFKKYHGDTGDLPCNKNHLVFKWDRDDCNILFSAAQKGKAVSSHFKSDKAGLRYIKEAIGDWFKFCRQQFPWAEMILAQTLKPSVKRVCLKLGFKEIWKNEEENKSALVRRL